MAETLTARILETCEQYPKMPALMVRGDAEIFSSITYRQFQEDIESLALGFMDVGVKPGDHVGLISDNRVEWILSDLALLGIGATDVPRGSDITVQELEYILSHAECRTVLVENPAVLAKLLQIRERLREIRTIVVLDERYKGGEEGVLPLDAIIQKGRKEREHHRKRFLERVEAGASTDLATIIYTSGTTGTPKGVMLAHSNLMHNVRIIPDYIGVEPGDVFMSILPPWHIFERTVEYVVLAAGATLAYSRPQRQILLKDLAMVRPQYMASVPRVWEGIYKGVMNNVRQQSDTKKKMFNFFVGIGKAYAEAQRVVDDREAHFRPQPSWYQSLRKARARTKLATLKPLHRLADKKVFSAIREKTGGRLTRPVSGGGALQPHVDEFFDTIGIRILEGYGLTETSPVVSARQPSRPVLRTIGPPIPETEVEIRDLHQPEKVLPPGQKGLVFVRGAQVMQGYYKDQEATERVLGDDGWLNTGDIGRLTIDGLLQIVGRAKDTIVLLGGENIEPAPIEAKLQESPYISQAMVVGQDRKVLAALIVPEWDALSEAAQGLGITAEGAALLKEEQVIQLYQEEIRGLISAANGFKVFERISQFRFIEKEFKVGAELTHTLKKRRSVIRDRYAKLIDGMFR
jgi:long-chain acyl-CoA synthetase